MLKSAIFPGSFDPFTNGHFDIVVRALNLFEKVTVAVLSNSTKSNLFTPEERVGVIEQALQTYGSRIAVKSFKGMLVDLLVKEDTKFIIRGLRAVSDFDYESQMALANKRLYREAETIFLVAREENSYVSSSLVRQIAVAGGDVATFVPQAVNTFLASRVKA